MSAPGRVPIAVTLDRGAAVRTCVDAEPFALRVTDDSMAPEFPAGSVVVVDPALAPRDGDYVIADVGGAPTLGRLVLVANGAASLRLLDPAGTSAIDGGVDAIHGVVTERVGRRRRDRTRYR